MVDKIKLPQNKLFIGNEWCTARSGKTFEVTNPATEEILGVCAEGDAADIDLAVSCARQAFDGGPWSRMSARERGTLLRKLADLVDSNKEELARLESLNNGKPIAETTAADLPLVIDCLHYYAGLADKIHGETLPVNGPYFNYTLREPVGVVGQIIPWNFPLLMAAWKLGPALASGCTVVLKPAEQTPFSALALAELIAEADFPPGVVNIVPGYGPTAGHALAAHPDVDKVAFTGSTEVGKMVMDTASKSNLKRVSLELGGKAPNIIFADADLDAAAKGAMTGIFFNQGEVCCAGSRLYVEESVRDEFLQTFKSHAESLRVGDPMHRETQMGAQVSQEQFDRILDYIEKGKSEGATLVTGGERAHDKGYFIKPTIFDCGDKADLSIVRDEIFGPVVSALKFTSEEEIQRYANQTNYGLSAGIWTKDISKAHRLARSIRAGTIWVNCYNCFDAASPFGGFKDSGFGRELGTHAIELYTEVKSVWVNLD